MPTSDMIKKKKNPNSFAIEKFVFGMWAHTPTWTHSET